MKQGGGEHMDLICEERVSDSPLVQRVWKSHSGEGGAFISAADPHWGMVITRWQGSTMVTVRGPETRATPAYGMADAEFVGIQFKPGAFMPHLPPKDMMDRCDVVLPGASSRSFWLHGAAWEFPNYDNIEGFVARLVREELLRYDSLVTSVLNGEPAETSLRTVQRRFLQVTGLTQGDVFKIQRAREAARLLKAGVSILDTVEAVGYYDQPHLTRSLKGLLGITPAQVTTPEDRNPLSFLYKT
jgi:AraC-like DNA-binding protein